MNRSESIIKIAPALLNAQKETGVATKDSQNPFFHSTYADLGSVMEACKDALNNNGISVLQPVGMDEQGNTYVETILLHESGEYISDRMRVTIKEVNNPQAQGSAITYARRYGLQSMVFIPAEDDDGEKATNHTEEKPKTTQAICLHKNTITKVAQTPANKGKEFIACADCAKFIKWVIPQGFEKDMIEDSEEPGK